MNNIHNTTTVYYPLHNWWYTYTTRK